MINKLQKIKNVLTTPDGSNVLDLIDDAINYFQVNIEKKPDESEKTFYDRLLEESQVLALKTNSLNDFMRTQSFVDLDRENKDLLYSQSRIMNEYLQILGKRLEILGPKFSFKKKTD